MMKLTRFALSLALMTSVAASGALMPAMAESHTDKAPAAAHEARHHKKMDHSQWKAKMEAFKQDLNLTAEQEAQIKGIKESFRETHQAELEAMKAKYKEVKALKKSGADEATVSAKRQELTTEFAGLKEAKKQKMADIRAVLNPEQQAKWDAKMEKYKNKRTHCKHKKQ